MNALVTTESDQKEAYDHDEHQTGVPVDRRLSTIGTTTPGGRGLRHLPACRFGGHDRAEIV